MQFKSFTLRTLQTMLPWTVKYSQDFRSNPQTHKDFTHALLHAGKALGKLLGLADDMDHDRELATDASLRDQYGNYVADLIICALRAANTFPGGVIDIEAVTVRRIEDKNGVDLPAGVVNKVVVNNPVTMEEVSTVMSRFRDARNKLFASAAKKPVTDFGCATDDSCGFPLHLPPTVKGGPSYPPHMTCKIAGDQTECLDCGQVWDAGDPLYPEVCTPLDPMKHMHETGWSDFPFKKPEVTSEPTEKMMHLLEQIARELFAHSHCFKVDGKTQYTVPDVKAINALASCQNWLRETPFVSNGNAATEELERLVAANLHNASASAFRTGRFAEVLIRWCERNPLA